MTETGLSSMHQAAVSIARIQDPEWYRKRDEKSFKAIHDRSSKLLGENPCPKDDLSEEVQRLAAQLQRELTQQFPAVQSGDLSGIEEMLLSQAVTLQVAFNHYASLASSQYKTTQFERFANVALRCQSEGRKTLQALVNLKCPRQAVFVHHQTNQLNLEANNHAEMDGSSTTAAIGAHQTVATLDAIHGPENGEWQGKGEPQQLPAWVEVSGNGSGT